MPNTVYKINDQDPLYNTSKLILHSNNLYGKIYTHLCINRNETSCGRREKNTHAIVIHLHTPVQMMEKTEKKQKRNADSNQRHRCKEQTLGLSERRQVWDDWRERIALKHVH